MLDFYLFENNEKLQIKLKFHKKILNKIGKDDQLTSKIGNIMYVFDINKDCKQNYCETEF